MNSSKYNIADLKKEIPYQWKIQTINKEKTKAQCVAYIDARDVMDLLDEVVGPENWQDKYENIGGKFIAGIGIYCQTSESGAVTKDWIWKYDTGTAGDFEKEKSEFSDAFKRAGVKWGVGRFLYNLEIRWVDYKQEAGYGYPIDSSGKRIYDLTEHFRNNPAHHPPKQKVTANEDISPQCSQCMDTITESVLNYSQKTYGTPLCYDCQQLRRTR